MIASPKRRAGAVAMGAGAGLIWSLGAVTNRLADDVDAFQYLIWRSIGIIVVIEVLARVRRERSPFVQSVTSGPLMILGSVGLLFASLGFVYAIKNTSAANAAFLSSLTPFVAAAGGWLFLRERVSRLTGCAMALGVIGLLVMVAGDFGGGSLKGNVSAVICSLGFGVYMVCMRSDRSLPWTAAMPGYAVPMIVLCGIVTLAGGRTLLPPIDDLALAVGHGAGFIVIGTLLFNAASMALPPVGLALVAQTETVAVPILIGLWFSEMPTNRTIVGALIILASLLLNAVSPLSGQGSVPT